MTKELRKRFRKTNSANAYCRICRSSVRIDNSGRSQVKAHASGDSHIKKEQLHAGKTTQWVFVSNISNSCSISLSNQSLVLFLGDQVLRTETLQALDYVSSNYSFASAKYYSDKFKLMFPDSYISSK